MASCSGSMPTRPIIARPTACASCARRSPTSKTSLASTRTHFCSKWSAHFWAAPTRRRRGCFCHTEEIVKAYLAQEMFGPLPPDGEFSVFATEGGTAAMTYIFQSLRANGLIKPGDKIAIATPIFSPYLEIPVLDDYQLEIVDIRMDRLDDWQLPAVRDRQAAGPRDQDILPRQSEQSAIVKIVGCRSGPIGRAGRQASRPVHRHRRCLRHVRRRFRLAVCEMPAQYAVRLFVLEILRRDRMASRRHCPA